MIIDLLKSLKVKAEAGEWAVLDLRLVRGGLQEFKGNTIAARVKNWARLNGLLFDHNQLTGMISFRYED